VLVEVRSASALARLLAGEQFDVILCDLMMPQQSGVEIYETLKAQRPELLERIVFMTGGAFTAHARAFVEGLPNKRLDKPFNLPELLSVVNGFMA